MFASNPLAPHTTHVGRGIGSAPSRPSAWGVALLLALTATPAAAWQVDAYTVIDEQKISEIASGWGGLDLDAGDKFGSAVAGLGDLNSDSIPDLIVGAQLDDDGGTDRGAVWVLFMNADGTVSGGQKISSTQGTLGGSIPLANLDGFGGALAVSTISGSVAVGAARAANGAGGVWILTLQPNGMATFVALDTSSLSLTPDVPGNPGNPPVPGDGFGTDVAWLGDLDGDGSETLAVGAPRHDDSGTNTNEGAVWILDVDASGNVGSPSTIIGTGNNFNFGAAVALVPDLAGAGQHALAVGEIFADSGKGAVTLFLSLDGQGTPSGSQRISATEGGFVGPLGNSDSFGASLAALGDSDNDTAQELAVGANGGGAIWILELSSVGLVVGEDKIAPGENGFEGGSNDALGTGVAVIGDLDLTGPSTLAIVGGAAGDGDSGTSSGAAWVMFTGPAPDCDDDGISDEEEIAGGAADCNGNGVPDEGCEMLDLTATGIASGAPALSTGGGTVVFDGSGFFEPTAVTLDPGGLDIVLPGGSVTVLSDTQLSVVLPPVPPGPDAAAGSLFLDVLFETSCGTALLSSAGGAMLEVTIDTLWVDNTAQGSTQDGTLANPFLTIQAGVGAAQPGHAVFVKHGTSLYVETVRLESGLHSVTLTSEDVDEPALTRIRAPQDPMDKDPDPFDPASPCVVFDGTGPDVVLTGFEVYLGDPGIVVQGGASPWIVKNRIDKHFGDQSGGGVRIDGTSSARIEANILAYNRSEGGDGGAIAVLAGGSAEILDNQFVGNGALGKGGAVAALQAASLTLSGNVLTANESGGDGGGLYLDVAGDVVLERNELRGNLAGGSGGGVRWLDSMGMQQRTMKGHLILGNRAEQNGGGLHVGNPQGTAMDVVLAANELSDNTAAGDGGGLYVGTYAVADLHLNRIAGNVCETGSGAGILWAGTADGTIRNNLVAGNRGEAETSSGGGLHVGVFGDPTIEHNIVRDNSAQTGGGIVCLVKSRPIVRRNVIAFNSVDQLGLADPMGDPPPYYGPGFLAQDQDFIPGPEPHLLHNTVHGNTSPTGEGRLATGGLHGIRVGFGEPDWTDNLLTANEDWGVFCQGSNAGVHIAWNGYWTNAIGDLNADAGPMDDDSISLDPGDPLYFDGAERDFVLKTMSPARGAGTGGSDLGAVAPDLESLLPFGDTVEDQDFTDPLARRSGACVDFPSGAVPASREVYLQIVHLPADDMPSAPLSIALDVRTFDLASDTFDASFGQPVSVSLPLRHDLQADTVAYLHRWDRSTDAYTYVGIEGEVDVSCDGNTPAAVFVGVNVPGTYVGLAEIAPAPTSLGQAFCFGDGDPYPPCCGNSSAPGAEEGCLHSGGVGAVLGGAPGATTSVSARGLRLLAGQLPVGNGGIFLCGTTATEGVQVFDGITCVGGSTLRLSAGFETSPGERLSGQVGTDQSLIGEGNIASPGYFSAGNEYVFSYWFRDVAGPPSPCGTGANFSSGLRVTLTP